MSSEVLLASGASPSHVNGPNFLYIYIYVTGDVHTVTLYVLLILDEHSQLVSQQCVAFN